MKTFVLLRKERDTPLLVLLAERRTCEALQPPETRDSRRPPWLSRLLPNCSKQTRKRRATRRAQGSRVAHEIQKSPREMQILFLFIMLPAQNEVTKYVAMTKYVTVCGQIY